ncbi:MAG: NlpC/P60 family protein, partial [Actinomycetota bacterium]|nr:NlpC/P60 family protein [Actinomycetota bacterium]
AERAAERAAIEQAAAEQAAAEEAAAQRAAERRAEQRAAERVAERRAEKRAAARRDEERRAAREASASASPSASAAPGGPARRAPGARHGGGVGGSGADVIAVGQQHLGTPYVLGGSAQCIAYEQEDCSCFTMLVYQEFGVALPDNPGAQMGYGTPVRGAPVAGDLLFWSEDRSGVITHVGIAMGDGTTIHASVFEGVVVQGTPINAIPGYVGARRVL